MPILDESIDGNSGQMAAEVQENLAASKAELADLRYGIILRARWESSDSVEPERRAQVRDELHRLRRQYSEKIDEIAMKIGVQQAMETQANVERNVTVPREARLPGLIRQEERRGI